MLYWWHSALQLQQWKQPHKLRKLNAFCSFTKAALLMTVQREFWIECGLNISNSLPNYAWYKQHELNFPNNSNDCTGCGKGLIIAHNGQDVLASNLTFLRRWYRKLSRWTCNWSAANVKFCNNLNQKSVLKNVTLCSWMVEKINNDNFLSIAMFRNKTKFNFYESPSCHIVLIWGL